MLSFHYPSNHLLIQPVMHTPVLCQLQLSLLSSQDFFFLLYHDKRRCITDSARHYLSTLPVACYARMCMPNIDFQAALFQIFSLFYKSCIIHRSFFSIFFELSTINKCQFYIEKHQHFGSSSCRQWRSPCFSNRDNAIHVRAIINLVIGLILCRGYDMDAPPCSHRYASNFVRLVIYVFFMFRDSHPLIILHIKITSQQLFYLPIMQNMLLFG